ncbi:MAG: AMP-binding protein [Acidimicrobiales bacterium]
MHNLVAVALPGGPGYVGELRRIFEDGDAALPVDTRLGDRAQHRLVDLMRPAAIIWSPGERDSLENPVPVEPGDALVMATSGTTGQPKGVVLTHVAIAASARATSSRLGVDRASDRWWACLPLAHIGGLSVVLRSILEGVALEVVPRFTPAAAASALAGGATLTALVPTALRRLDEPVASSFRRIVLGGQAPPDHLPANVVTTYGMTETGSGVVYDGIALEGVELRVGAGDGQIFVRGPMLLRSYRDGTDPKTGDGWLATGDAGRLGQDGRLEVNGRLGDLVITGGENIWPSAVEPLLERHRLVTEAAVGGRPDQEWGERLTAYVVVASPIDTAVLLSELRELVSEELAGFAAPREVVVVAELPRTSLGKVRREALRGLEGPSARL